MCRGGGYRGLLRLEWGGEGALAVTAVALCLLPSRPLFERTLNSGLVRGGQEAAGGLYRTEQVWVSGQPASPDGYSERGGELAP